jgi:hypothetical protein
VDEDDGPGFHNCSPDISNDLNASINPAACSSISTGSEIEPIQAL